MNQIGRPTVLKIHYGQFYLELPVEEVRDLEFARDWIQFFIDYLKKENLKKAVSPV